MGRNTFWLTVFFVLLLIVLTTGCGNDAPKEIIIEEIEITNPPSPEVNTPAPEAVIEESAPISCEDIQDADLMDRCWLEQAQESMQIASCERMSEKTGEIYNQCIDNVARLTGDAKLCNKISSDNEREACLNIVCMIKGVPDRENCLSDHELEVSEPSETTSTTSTLPPTTTSTTSTTTTTTSTTTTEASVSGPDLVLVDTIQVENAFGLLWIDGRVSNNGDTEALSVQVRLTVYSKQRIVLQILNSVPIDRIGPGETLEYNTIRSDKITSAVGRYELTIVQEK